MAVKLPGASGDLKISGAPTSVLDTAATVSSALGLGVQFDGRPVFELEPDEPRERHHYHYMWTREDWESEYTGPIQEITINGPIYRLSSWQLARRFLPPEGDDGSSRWGSVKQTGQ